MLRSDLLNQLRTQPFDLLIIGGGIVGAGLARDAAMRGLRAALVEQGDFASGTSSKTSKLIHGGLRYLEHGHLGLVHESLRERHILRTIAPQLVRPLSLLLPIYRGDPKPPALINAGLALYDLLAAGRSVERHQLFDRDRALDLEPRLNPAALRAVARFGDCQMQDARLCLANILQAVNFGAVCCNYVRLMEFRKASGRLRGAVLTDLATGDTFEVRATTVVNATGPWSDTVRRMSARRAASRLAPTKGVHLVVPCIADHALYVRSPRDRRRMVFILPWNGCTLLGTTESGDVDNLGALQATSDEAEYLLDIANYAVPSARLGLSDIIASFAGARPLLAFSGLPTHASREHRVDIDHFGLVSIMGGKYTTFRAMAKHTLDVVLAMTRRRIDRCLTDQVSLLEATQPVVLDQWQDVAQQIPDALMGRLLGCYGVGTFRILHLLAFEPRLADPICPHHEHIQAEFVYSMQEELVSSISDLLMRRTLLAFGPCHGLDALPVLRDLMARYGKLSLEQLDDQEAAYRQEIAQSLACRGGVESAEALTGRPWP